MLLHLVTGHYLSALTTHEAKVIALLRKIEDMVFAERNVVYLGKKRRGLLRGDDYYSDEKKEDDRD